jgi:hypothetical protein
MITLNGKYNTAKVFTDNVEQEAISQIITLLNQDFARDSVIRIMPDTHAGAGCTIFAYSCGIASAHAAINVTNIFEETVGILSVFVIEWVIRLRSWSA